MFAPGIPQIAGVVVGVLLVTRSFSHAAQPAAPTNQSAGLVATRPFLEEIRSRPPPNLSQLFARCWGSGTNRVSNPLYDILKLRESPDPAAVPALAQILSEFRHSHHTFEYAASQALYAIGTPEAHAVLADVLIANFMVPKYPAKARPYFTRGNQFGFANYWLMQEPARSGFIGRYVLTNLSSDLAVDVSYKAYSNAPVGWLEFQVGLSNTTDRAFLLPNFGTDLLWTMLYLRDTNGLYAIRARVGPGPLGGETRGNSKLLPSQRRTYTFSGLLRTASTATEDSLFPPFVLEFRNYRHYLNPGEYSLIAMCEAIPLAYEFPDKEEEKRLAEFANEPGWWGRAVSKPVPFRVAFGNQGVAGKKEKR